jgi:tetratricopeptide (TPR) repeat protein
MKMIGTSKPGNSKITSLFAALLIAGGGTLATVPADAQSIPIGLGLGLGRSLIRSASKRRSYSDPNASSGMYGAGGNGTGTGTSSGTSTGLSGYPTYYGYPNGSPKPNSPNPYDPSASAQPGGAPVYLPSDGRFAGGNGNLNTATGYPGAPNVGATGYPGAYPGAGVDPSTGAISPSGYPGAPSGYPGASGGYPYGGQMSSFNQGSNPGSSSRSHSRSSRSRGQQASISAYNKSIKYFNEQKFDQAMPLLSQAIQQDPHYGTAYALLAVCQSKTGHYQDAMQSFQSAHTFNGKYQYLSYEEGMCAGRLHDYRTAETCLQHFLSRHEGEGNLEKATEALAIIQHNFGKQSDSDYVCDAQNEGKRRWSTNGAPLRVYIKENASLRGYHTEYPAIVKQAFDEWSQGTNGKVLFVYTADPAEAQIKVSWTDNSADLVAAGGDSRELGLTLTTFSDGVIESADIKLHTLVGVCRDDVSEVFPQAKSVALHEIGHAMGLNHSTQPYDTMYPLVPPKGFEFALTKRDVNTMASIYNGNDAPRTAVDPYKNLPQTELAAQRSK